jgi:hypothetical protein
MIHRNFVAMKKVKKPNETPRRVRGLDSRLISSKTKLKSAQPDLHEAFHRDPLF